jgi:hypothetical protein
MIADQRAYHQTNGRRLEVLHERLDTFGLIFVSLGFAVSLLFMAVWWLIGDAATDGCTPGTVADILAHLPATIRPAIATARHLAAVCTTEERAKPLHMLGYMAAFLGSIGPAIAAACAGVRYHGDYERFAKRSIETAAALARLEVRTADLAAKAEQCGGVICAGPPPMFEDLLELMLDTRAVLDEDLSDWRFAYAARPMPLP